MRRIIALLVLSALGLPLIAVNLGNTAIASGSQSLTRYQFAHEVSDIATNSAISCYVNSLWGVTFTAGAGTNTMDASSITTWANLRLEGMAEEEYATKYLGFQLTDSTFNAALTNLSNQMMAAAAANGVSEIRHAACEPHVVEPRGRRAPHARSRHGAERRRAGAVRDDGRRRPSPVQDDLGPRPGSPPVLLLRSPR